MKRADLAVLARRGAEAELEALVRKEQLLEAAFPGIRASLKRKIVSVNLARARAVRAAQLRAKRRRGTK